MVQARSTQDVALELIEEAEVVEVPEAARGLNSKASAT
jgi:hypothetical protein